MSLGNSVMAFPCQQRMIGGDGATELEMRMIEDKCLIIRSKLRTIRSSNSGSDLQRASKCLIGHNIPREK